MGTKKTSFAGDVVKLVSGTTIAQLLGILAAPLLARLYAPDAFGVAALFISTTSIIQVISCMRYELAIVLPESDEEAVNLLGVSMGFVGLITILTTTLVWLAGPAFIKWTDTPEFGSYLWLIPLTTLVNGLLLAFTYWNSRKKQFGQLSISRMLTSVVTSGGKIGLGTAGFATPGSLIIGTVSGWVTACIYLSGHVWRNDRVSIYDNVRWHAMVEGMKRHYKFPMYSTWSALLNVISWQLPVFLLTAFFSPTIVGYYALGERMIRLPMNIIGGSIGQVFFQRASEVKGQNPELLADVVFTAFKQLVSFSLVPLLVLTIVGADAFVLVFGPQWQEAGVYTQILTVWTFFWFISSPMSTLYSVLEKQDWATRIHLAILISRLVSLGIGGYLGSPRAAIALFSVSGVVVYGYLSYSIVRETGVALRDIGAVFIPQLAIATPTVIIIVIVQSYFASALVTIMCAGVLVGLYYSYICLTDPKLRKIIAPLENSARRLAGI